MALPLVLLMLVLMIRRLVRHWMRSPRAISRSTATRRSSRTSSASVPVKVATTRGTSTTTMAMFPPCNSPQLRGLMLPVFQGDPTGMMPMTLVQTLRRSHGLQAQGASGPSAGGGRNDG